jgi:hypothetical protein
VTSQTRRGIPLFRIVQRIRTRMRNNRTTEPASAGETVMGVPIILLLFQSGFSLGARLCYFERRLSLITISIVKPAVPRNLLLSSIAIFYHLTTIPYNCFWYPKITTSIITSHSPHFRSCRLRRNRTNATYKYYLI